jgi:hypothetical protein
MDQAVLDRLRDDPEFAVDFIIDNNPAEVQAHLSGLNLLSVVPQDATNEVLKQDVRRITDPQTLEEVLRVPYINDAGNYTGGYGQALDTTSTRAAGAGLAIFQGISTLGTAAANYFTSQNQAAIAAEATAQAQILADAQVEQAQIALEQEKTKRTFGIPTNAFLIIVGSIAAIIIVAMATAKR